MTEIDHYSFCYVQKTSDAIDFCITYLINEIECYS